MYLACGTLILTNCLVKCPDMELGRTKSRAAAFTSAYGRNSGIRLTLQQFPEQRKPLLACIVTGYFLSTEDSLALGLNKTLWR